MESQRKGKLSENLMKRLASYAYEAPTSKLGSPSIKGDSGEEEERGSGGSPSASQTHHVQERDVVVKGLPKSRKRKVAEDKGMKSLHGASPKKPKRAYAHPAEYAHLHELNDYIRPGLDIIFCGINPGQVSAKLGHHFANPTNHFWSCLHESGLTPVRMKPSEDHTLPERFNYGMTNLVHRPTAEAAELSKSESEASVPELLAKVHHHRPKVVCFVGISIAETVRAYVIKNTPTRGLDKGKGNNIKAGPGVLPFKVIHPDNSETVFYTVSSTSGRVVRYQKSDKVSQFRGLRDLVTAIKSGEHDSSQAMVLAAVPQSSASATGSHGGSKE